MCIEKRHELTDFVRRKDYPIFGTQANKFGNHSLRNYWGLNSMSFGGWEGGPLSLNYTSFDSLI
jgi:hypothetical protein